MTGRRKFVLCARAASVLIFVACAGLFAQSGVGALAGRVTDLHSRPLDGASLTLRNCVTGEERHTTTAGNGSYRFPSLGAGEYTLVAELHNLGRGRLDGIVIVAGHEARVQAAMAFAPELPAPSPVVVPRRAAFEQRVTYAAPRLASSVSAPLLTAAVVEGEIPPRTLVAAELPARRAPEALGKAVSAASSFPAHFALSPPAVTPPLASDVADSRIAAAVQPLVLVPLAVRLSLRSASPAVVPEPFADRTLPAELAVLASPPARLPLVAALSPSLARTAHLAAPASSVTGTVAALHVALSPWAAAAPALVRAAVLSAHAAIAEAAREALSAAANQADDAAPVPAATLTAAELDALPLGGRSWESTALDIPVATPDDTDETRTAAREFPASITVDGMDTRLAYGMRTSGHAAGRNASLIGPGSSEAAIREVQVATGATGVGRGTGSHARVETARGGDRLHGTAALFAREGLWGAQNPFSEWTRESVAATATSVPQFAGQPLTPDERDINWDVAAGGRIVRSRFRWYTSLSSRQHDNPGVAAVRHPDNFFAQPSNDQMQVLAARLGFSSADPVGEGIAAYSKMLETLVGLLGPAPRTDSRWNGFGRVDGSLGQRSRITVEGTAALRDAPGGGLSRLEESYGTNSFGSSHTSEQWLMARWETLLTPGLISVTQASFGHYRLTHAPETPSPFEQSLNVSSWGRLPQISVDTGYGFTIGNPARFGTGNYPDEQSERVQELLAWTHGKLQLRAGFELGHTTDATSFLRNQTGTYSYSSVENFASDALSFAAFGLNGQLNPYDQHNCDQTGKVWRNTTGTLHGLGDLPCYSHYTQTMGPANWWLKTDDWAGYVTAQARPDRHWTLTIALRWEFEQVPPPIAALANADLPLAGRLPNFGSEWGPRVGLAWSAGGRYAPVLRLGYGIYFNRTPNATLQTALTQTGSPKGDLKYFLRPTDNLNIGGAPPFPYVLAGKPATSVKPQAVEFAPGYRNGEVHQAAVSVEQTIPGRIHVEAAMAASLGRRLPLLLDANIDPAVNPGTITYAVVDGDGSGPIKVPQIKVPFYATWPTPYGAAGRIDPGYDQIGEAFSRANSTYEAASLRLTRTGRDGLMFHARYTYAHTMDWNPDDSITFARPSVLDPENQTEEYGTSDLDARHMASIAVIWQPRWRVRGWADHITDGWRLSSAGSFRSGLPYTMRTSSALPREFNVSGALITGLGTGMNGYGGDNRIYGVGRNTFRYPSTWKADLRLAKHFPLGELHDLELLIESFNLFNHQNVTELESIGYTMDSGTISGGLPSLHFLTGLKSGQTAFGQPLNVDATDFLRQRQVEFGMRFRF